MKVSELISHLQAIVDEDAEIVMSSDGEGNNFSPLDDISIGRYYPVSTWSGDFSDNPEDYKEMGNSSQIAVAFWPTN